MNFIKVDAKRSELSFNGFDMPTIEKAKYGGNAVVTMPNRSIGKGTEKVTIYLDLSGVCLKDVLISASEQWKTRASQELAERLTEAGRAKIAKDGFWHIRVNDWLVEKATSTGATAYDKAKSAVNKLSPEEKAALLAALTEK